MTDLHPVLYADVILEDIDNKLDDLVPVVIVGGTVEATVADLTARELLAQVLTALTTMNTHLAILTENEIAEEDVLE